MKPRFEPWLPRNRKSKLELTVAETRVHNQMYQLLTPDQQAKLKEIEANHEARMQSHMHGRGSSFRAVSLQGGS